MPLVCVLLVAVATASVLDSVNTLIGTGGAGFGVGSIPPGPQVPFGMMRLGPDTAEPTIYEPWNHDGGYYYPDLHIRAFSHTHMVGAGVPDLGHIGVMPVTVPVTSSLLKDYGFRATFRHATETAKPGYYAVLLDTWKVRAELTATMNAGVHRYTFPSAGAPANLLVYASHCIQPKSAKSATITIDPAAQEVTGFSVIAGALSARFGGAKVYYVARFNTRFSAFGTWANDTVHASVGSQSGGDVGGWVTFPSATNLAVEMYIGISFVSLAQARTNLAAQIGSSNFDTIKNATQALWLAQMADVVVTGGDADAVEKMYSAVYRTKMAPTTFSEEGGAYLGFDMNVHTVPAGQLYYTDMSIWDIHRSEIPFITMTRPDITRDIVKSLLLMAEQGGDLPRWPLANGYTGCMIGTHANQIIVDALLKGASQFNVSEAYEFMYLQATEPRPRIGRDDIQDWLSKGYIPSDKAGASASLTLAYAFDDWSVATVAQYLGRTSDVTTFMTRAKNNYKNLWNSDRKIFCGKNSTGAWTCPSNDFEWGKLYTEGNALQWRWFVPQDIEGLIGLFGGKQTFVTQLDEFISKSRLDPSNFLPNPYYWAGNEPDILAPWMFVPAGSPALTQKWTRWLVDNKFTPNADGIPGNDDYGTMSAWLAFAYLGLYPLAGSDVFFLGSPYFSQAAVKFGGSTLTITAHNASPANFYVQKVTLNGAPVTNATVTFSQLVGATLEFWMQSTPPS